MSLTKDEVSDLKSLIQRSEDCALKLEQAKAAKDVADRQLTICLLSHQVVPR